MSRLIDKLTRIRRIEPQPLGFAVGKPTPEKPRMQLVASLAPKNLEKLAGEFAQADAVIIQIARVDDVAAIEKTCQAEKSSPAGGWLQSFDDEILSKLLDTTCDFAVFTSDSPLISLKKDGMGRVMQIDPSISEGLLRTTNDLPLDAVLISNQAKEGSLTFNHLMSIQRLVNLINKPVLLEISNDLTNAELQAIWDTGVSGVVVELSDKKSAEKFVKLRESIGKLTPAAVLKRARMSPMLPHFRGEEPAPEKSEEEEDE